MPNGYDRGMRVRPGEEEDAQRGPESSKQFETELKAMIDTFGHFPSIVMWVLFNEGMGQYDVKRVNAWTGKYDPSRLVNSVSGWADRGVGHVHDAHVYPGPGMESPEPDRASVLGEFGGLGWPVPGHLWWDKRNWGYRTHQSRKDLNAHYRTLIRNLRPLIPQGLAAAVYTQTTDVEGEVNGLMTYDRAVLKFDPAEFGPLNSTLYENLGRARTLAGDSERKPQMWRYTVAAPAEGWKKPGFDDSGWKEGKAPFTSEPNPFLDTGTLWKEPALHVRRRFTLEKLPDGIALNFYSELQSCAVYLNGKLVAELTVRSKRHYRGINISEHVEALKSGENVLAVEAKAGQGRSGIDVGLVGLYGVRNP
jgi:hypothetical protein